MCAFKSGISFLDYTFSTYKNEEVELDNLFSALQISQLMIRRSFLFNDLSEVGKYCKYI